MSSLNPSEKNIFEILFNMNSGYVLDLSNDRFAEFFRQTAEKDIFSDKYAFNGNSKAKRFLAFLEVESDCISGKVLSEMLEIWNQSNLANKSKQKEAHYNQCKNIIRRLLGKTLEEEDSQEKFLKKDFENISVSKLDIDPDLVPILENRLAEANKCLQNDSPLAVIFLCGSILEGVLLGKALRSPQKFNQAKNSPKDKSGKVKKFQEWSLSEFIDVAHQLKLLKLDVKKFSHQLRDFRNYIHPFQQRESKFTPDKHTAEISLQVLKAAIASLCGERS